MANQARVNDENQYMTSKEENSKAQFLKQIMRRNISATTFHTVGDIYNEDDVFLRFVLAICFLTSSGLCGYFTMKTFVEFFSYGVLTSNTIVSNIPTECIILYNLMYINSLVL
jgi:hypothetical protein